MSLVSLEASNETRFPPFTALPDVHGDHRVDSRHRDRREYQDIGLWTNYTVSVTRLAEPEQVPALSVTDGVLGILGVQPILGRSFTRKDDTPGSPDTVMLSYGYWQRKFGGDPNIAGRGITVDGKPREIIGVLPRTFNLA